jgi:hypothetical protein
LDVDIFDGRTVLGAVNTTAFTDIGYSGEGERDSGGKPNGIPE